MTALITIDDVLPYLQQVDPNDGTALAALEPFIDRANDIVSMELSVSGLTFGPYPGSATDKFAVGEGVSHLALPAHLLGSVTAVVEEQGASAITGYTEDVEDGSLYLVAVTSSNYWYYPYLWQEGHRYKVTAKWGSGPAPDALKEVAIELAVNLWREKDTGMFRDVIGVEGAGGVAVGYAHAWTNRQRATLDMIKRKYLPRRVI